MAEKPIPGGGFSAPAAGLAPVAGQVEAVKRKAEIEGLKLDPTAATALVNTLARLRAQVADLVTDCGDLDQPLKFGANFVGQTVAGRLQKTADGGTTAVTPVLTAFGNVLGDLQAVVQAAAGRYTVTDEESAKKFRKQTSPFGLLGDV